MAMCKFKWDYPAICKMYASGMSIWAMGEKLGVDGRLVRYHLKKAGVTLRKSTDVKQERNAKAFSKLRVEIAAQHQAGATLKALQRKYAGVGKDKIAALCAELPQRQPTVKPRPEIRPETRAALSASAKRQYQSMTKEQRDALRLAASEAKRGERNHNYGKVWSKQGRGKRTKGFDCDGNPVTFRSTWEKVFADHLNASGLKWAYEPEAIRCGSLGTYTPDFYVEEWGTFVEVKGWMTPHAKAKINWFRQHDPRPLVLATKSVLRNQYHVGVN